MINLFAMWGAVSGLWQEIFGAAIVLIIAWGWSRWHSSVAWRKKQFKDKVVLSLNTLKKDEEGKQHLILRTFFERTSEELFKNPVIIKIVNKAIDTTTVGEPILKLEKEEAWYVLNAILNQMVELFPLGTLKNDMGLAVENKWYTFCLTFEREGGIRMQKLRIMLIQKDTLLNFPEEGEILLESPKHDTRIKTLRTLKKEYKENKHLFMDIQLGV